MCSPEMIAKLCAGVVNPHAVRGSSAAALSRSELAGLLAGLSSEQMNFALAKYADDDFSKLKFLRNMLVFVTTLALREGWQPRSREVLQGLACLAVIDALQLNRLSGRECALIVGIDCRQWERVWRVRYDAVAAYVSEIESEIAKKIFKNNLVPIDEHLKNKA